MVYFLLQDGILRYEDTMKVMDKDNFLELLTLSSNHYGPLNSHSQKIEATIQPSNIFFQVYVKINC